MGKAACLPLVAVREVGCFDFFQSGVNAWPAIGAKVVFWRDMYSSCVAVMKYFSNGVCLKTVNALVLFLLSLAKFMYMYVVWLVNIEEMRVQV